MLKQVPLTSAELRHVFGQFPSGVAAVAAEVDGVAHALVVSSFTVGVSLDPPMVALFVQRDSSTWPLLSGATGLGVSVLGAGSEDVCRQLSSSPRERRFDGVTTTAAPDGALFVHHSSAWLHCVVAGCHPAGDHDLVLLEIRGVSTQEETPPLVFHRSRFRQLA